MTCINKKINEAKKIIRDVEVSISFAQRIHTRIQRGNRGSGSTAPGKSQTIG